MPNDQGEVDREAHASHQVDHHDVVEGQIPHGNQSKKEEVDKSDRNDDDESDSGCTNDQESNQEDCYKRTDYRYDCVGNDDDKGFKGEHVL